MLLISSKKSSLEITVSILISVPSEIAFRLANNSSNSEDSSFGLG